MSPRTRFWLGRFAVATAVAFVGIAAGRTLLGRDIAETLAGAALWAPVAGAIFTASRFYHASRGRRCDICGDEPR